MRLFKSKLVVASIILALILGGGFLLLKARNNSNKTKPTNTVDYSGPTKQEAAAGDAQKERNRQRAEADKNTSPPKTAEIVIVDAGQYEDTVEVRAYVSNVYENGGSCNVTFVKGSQRVSRSSQAFQDVTTTQCSTISIPRSEFTAGEWQYSVSYSSPSTSGSTTSRNLTIK